MGSLLLAFLLGVAVASNAVSESGYRARKEYRYKYETQIITGLTHDSQQRTGYKMSCTARVQFTSKGSVTGQFENIVLYQINQPVVQMEADANILPNENLNVWASEDVSQVLQYLQNPFAFKYTKGHVTSVALDSEPDWSLNVKKGFVAMFEVNLEKRFSLEDDETSQDIPRTADIYTVFERSPTGDCATLYTTQQVTSQNKNLHEESSHVSVRKVRDYSRCLEESIHITSPFSGVQLGDQMKTNPLSRQASIDYMIKAEEDRFIILSAVSQEKIVFSPYYDPSSVEEIRTSVNQTLTFLDSTMMADTTLIIRPRIPRSKWQHLALSLPAQSNNPQDPFQSSRSQKKLEKTELNNPFYMYTPEKIAEQFIMIAKNSEVLTSKESLVHLRLATEMMRTSGDHLSTVWQILHIPYDQKQTLSQPKANKHAAEIFWSALPHVGTDEAANVILDVCTNYLDMSVNCTESLSIMTLTVTPTPTIIEKIINLAKMYNEINPAMRQKIYLALGSFGHKLRESKVRQLRQADTAADILQNLARDNSKFLRRFVKQQTQAVEMRRQTIDRVYTNITHAIIEALTPLVENTTSAPDQILGLKAVGNSGLPQAVPLLQQVLAQPQTSDYVKVMAIEAHRRLASQPFDISETDFKEVQLTLFNIFLNTSEPTSVRVTAFKALMLLAPELPVVEEIATRMNTEPDIHVSSYVLSFLQAFANTTFSPFHELSRRYSIALKAAPAHVDNVQNSFFKLRGQYSDEYRMGVAAAFEKIGAMDEFSRWSVHLDTMIFGLFSKAFAVGVNTEGMGQILSALMGPPGIRKTDNPQTIIQQIIKELKIKAPALNPPSGDMFLRVMGNEVGYVDFTSLAQRLVSQGLPAPIGVSGNTARTSFDYRKVMLLMNVKLSLPTESGLPVGLQAQLSTAVSAGGNVGLHLPSVQTWHRGDNLTFGLDVNSNLKMVLGMYASMGMDGFFLKPTAGFYGMIKYQSPIKKEFRLTASTSNISLEIDSFVDQLKKKPVVETIVEPMTEYVSIPTSATTPMVNVNVQPIFASQGVRTVPLHSVVPLTWLGWKLQVTGQKPVQGTYPIPTHPLQGRSLMNIWFQPLDSSSPEKLRFTMAYINKMPKIATYDKFSHPMQSSDQSPSNSVMDKVMKMVSEQLPQMPAESNKKFVFLVNASSEAVERDFGAVMTWQEVISDKKDGDNLVAIVFRSPIPGVSNKPWMMNVTYLSHYPRRVYEPQDIYDVYWQRDIMQQVDDQIYSAYELNQFVNLTVNGMMQQYNYPAMTKVPAYRILDGLIPQHLFKVSSSVHGSADSSSRNWQQWWRKLKPIYDKVMDEKRRLVDQNFLSRDDFVHDSLKDLHETQLALMGELEQITAQGLLGHSELPILTWVVMAQADIVITFRDLFHRYSSNGQITRLAEIKERIDEDTHMSWKLIRQVLEVMDPKKVQLTERNQKNTDSKKQPPQFSQLIEDLRILYGVQTEVIQTVQHAIMIGEDASVEQVGGLISQMIDNITFFDSVLATHPIHNTTIIEKLMAVTVQNELLIHMWQSYLDERASVKKMNKVTDEEMSYSKQLKVISQDLSLRVDYLYRMNKVAEMNDYMIHPSIISKELEAIRRNLFNDSRFFHRKLFSNTTTLQDPAETKAFVEQFLFRVDRHSNKMKEVIDYLVGAHYKPHVYLTGAVLQVTQWLKDFVEGARAAMIPLSYSSRLPLINELDQRITSVQSIIASLSRIFDMYSQQNDMTSQFMIPSTLSLYKQLFGIEAVLTLQEKFAKQLIRIVQDRSVQDEKALQLMVKIFDKAEQLQQSLQHAVQNTQQQPQDPRQPTDLISSAIAQALEQQGTIYSNILDMCNTGVYGQHCTPEMKHRVISLQQQLSALGPQEPTTQYQQPSYTPDLAFGTLNITWGEDKMVEGMFDIQIIAKRSIEQSYYIFNQLKALVRSQNLVDGINRHLSGQVGSADSLMETLNTYNHVHLTTSCNITQIPSWFSSYLTSAQESLKHNLWNFYTRRPTSPSLKDNMRLIFDVSQLNKKFEMTLVTRDETNQFVNVPLSPMFDVLKPTQNLRTIYNDAVDFLGMAPYICLMNQHNIKSFYGAELALPEPEDHCGQLLYGDSKRNLFIVAKPGDHQDLVHKVEIYAYDYVITVIPGALDIKINVKQPSVPSRYSTYCSKSQLGLEPDYATWSCFEILKKGSSAEIRLLAASLSGIVVVVDGSLIKVMVPQTSVQQATGMCLAGKTSKYLGPDQQVLPNAKAFALSYRVPSSECPASKRVYHDSFQQSSKNFLTFQHVHPQCDGRVHANGKHFCLRNPDRASSTYREAKKICSQYEGGQLPEANTVDDLEIIKSLVPKEGDIWMSATYNNQMDEYEWPSGFKVKKDLWDTDEPNHKFHGSQKCTAIYRGHDGNKLQRLMDLYCDMRTKQLQILCAFPM